MNERKFARDTINAAPGIHQFRQMLEHLPQMVFWADVKHQAFLGCNRKFADFVGIESPEEIIGTTGYSFFEQELVDEFRSVAQEVVKTRIPHELASDFYSEKSGITMVQGTVVPILDENNQVESVIGYGTPCIILSEKTWQEAIRLVNKENIRHIVRNSKYPIKTEFGVVKISRREAECCLYLLKGLTAKDIAEQMILTPKTVENYIENIKNKIGCSTRSELTQALVDGEFILHF